MALLVISFCNQRYHNIFSFSSIKHKQEAKNTHLIGIQWSIRTRTMAKIFSQKLKILPKSEMRATCYCKSGSKKKNNKGEKNVTKKNAILQILFLRDNDFETLIGIRLAWQFTMLYVLYNRDIQFGGVYIVYWLFHHNLLYCV